MLSLHLSEWLEWKCKSEAQLVGFLSKAVESLGSGLLLTGSSCLGRISLGG